MRILEIYSKIIYYLSQLVPERFVELLGLFGLIITVYGAFILINPLLKSNKEIEAISSYRNSGAILSMGHTIEKNKTLEKDLKEDRKFAFKGAIFILVGFSLQLLEKSINISFSEKINWFLFIILIVAFIIIVKKNVGKIKIKKGIMEILDE